MKKIIGFSLLTVAALALINRVKNKKKALENFEIGSLEMSIDTNRSRAAFWTKLYYKLKIQIINPEQEDINLLGLNLNIIFRGNRIANLDKKSSIVVPAGGSKIIEIDSTILSINVITAIVDYLADNDTLEFNIKGYLESNLGRLPVDMLKKIK